jgi:hypothetical protein
MSKKIFLLAIPLAATQLGNTDCGQIIKDPGFDLWCGDHLCYWKVERGQAERVPTWHAGDDGVSMIGDDVLITQLTPVTSSDGTCIEFKMLTNIDLNADVHLQFDVFGDGTVDYDQVVPAASWEPVRYTVKIPPSWNGIEFRLAKKGPGQAVLAEIQAQTIDDSQCGSTTITLPPHPNGGYCLSDSDCASNYCVAGGGGLLGPPGMCAACSNDTQCLNGTVCGTDDAVGSTMTPYRACIPAASRTLGELCAEDAECASGICNQTCSLCKGATDCASGEMCKPANQAFPAPNGFDYYSVATYECDPDLHKRAPGEACFRDDDCASARCNGTPVMTCIDVYGGGDGRTCTSDLDCPENSALQHTPCAAVGIAGGTCQ